LRKNKEEKRKGKILIINASEEKSKHDKVRKLNMLKDENIKKIVEVYDNFSNKKGLSRVVPIEEIAKNDYSLNVTLYVTKEEEEEKIDTKKEWEEYKELGKKELEIVKKIEGKMQQLLTKGIGHKKFKKSEIGEIPEEWEVVKVKNLFEKAKNKRIIGIKTKEYLKEGKFPIIDQSNKFISGYTNDENRVYKGDLPIIIFGDHTKIFKFLDFPFALGADGTKILILKKNYNIKYIYYILNFIKFQNEGYRRHIDILREKVIAISSNSIEQQKIAEVLSTIDELIELEKQRKKKLEKYKKGLMNDLLTGRKRVKIN